MQLQDIVSWMMNIALQYGYVGVFFISLMGAVSVFFPVPDTAVVFVLGGSLVFEPAWLAAAAAIGACIGEFTGYMFGLGGRKAFKKRYGKRIDFLERLVKRYGSLTIFIFAATPLPDDLIFIPLGLMRYSIVKAFVPAFLGKLLFDGCLWWTVPRGCGRRLLWRDERPVARHNQYYIGRSGFHANA